MPLIRADARAIPLADESVQCCVTSPPYWGLRDYGTAKWEGGEASCGHVYNHGAQGANGDRADRTFTAQAVYRDACRKCGARRIDRQLGLESTPEEYVAAMVSVFREVWRVLRKDGTVWCNLGDSYNAYNGNAGPGSGFSAGAACDTERPKLESGHGLRTKGLKPKDLCMIPARVALALQADGWYLRSDIIWHKPNPMPESVTDRPTKAHEYVFLLSKSARYYYDAGAVREQAQERDDARPFGDAGGNRHGDERSVYTPTRLADAEMIHGNKPGRDDGGRNCNQPGRMFRNARSVWTIATAPFLGAHFATFPPELAERCILAGSRPGDVVLDPFVGSGTTVAVARRHDRYGVGLDISSVYLHDIALARGDGKTSEKAIETLPMFVGDS